MVERNKMHSTNSIAVLLFDVAAISVLAILWRRIRRLSQARRMRRSLRIAVLRELAGVEGSGGDEDMAA